MSAEGLDWTWHPGLRLFGTTQRLLGEGSTALLELAYIEDELEHLANVYRAMHLAAVKISAHRHALTIHDAEIGGLSRALPRVVLYIQQGLDQLAALLRRGGGFL